MKKRLYLTAAVTSPIIALYGASPLVIFVKLRLIDWLDIVAGISVEVAIIWLVHIYFELRYPSQKPYVRFIVSYIISTASRIPFLFLLPFFKSLVPPLVDQYILYPILTTFAVNIIVMVIVQSIVNGYKKAESEKQLQELKWQNTEAQKQVLMQQLQPHFLFNALSTLKSLVAQRPKDAEDYILKLSDFLRYSLQSKNQELLPLEKELQFVSDYLELQHIRFANTFIAEIDIEDKHLNSRIPVLALQIVVENIFKHNYFTERHPLHFRIRTEADTLVVWNQKTSVKLAQRNHTGLKNLEARYRLFNSRGIEVRDEDDSFQVTLPLL